MSHTANTQIHQGSGTASRSGLTDTACRNASCPDLKKKIRLYDTGGLYLEVSKTSKRWFLKYRRPDQTETRLAVGIYPLITLKTAREHRDEAKRLLNAGLDPVRERVEARTRSGQEREHTFDAVANTWFNNRRVDWGPDHQTRERRNLDKDLIPWLGSMPVAEITAPILLGVIQKIEARGSLDVAHRVLSTARSVFAFSVACGKAERNCAMDLQGALKPHRGKHFGAIIEPAAFGQLLLTLDGYAGSPAVRAALKLAPMLFQRPTELRAAKWGEFSLESAMWRIPSKRMKRRKRHKEEGEDHFVPLPHQAVDILKSLKRLTGDEGFLFPSERGRSRSISDGTMRAALQSLGYGSDVQTIHGFRASARTMIDECLEVDFRLIEAQLAHSVKDANGRAYNRTTYLHQRKQMMQTWADYLDRLKVEAASRSKQAQA